MTLKELISSEQCWGQIFAWSLNLILICIVGDHLCSSLRQSSQLWKAVADSATHGAVGMISWAVVVVPGLSLVKWIQCALCGILASILDVDHFLQARSLQLKDVLNLKDRPPFHSTSLVFAVISLSWIFSFILHLPQLKKFTTICFVAWFSHHLRDAARRGLWFPPLGSTSPLPYTFYIITIVILALVMHFVYPLCCVTTAGDDNFMTPSAILVR